MTGSIKRANYYWIYLPGFRKGAFKIFPQSVAEISCKFFFSKDKDRNIKENPAILYLSLYNSGCFEGRCNA